MSRTDISIRPLNIEDEPFLWEMLYQALYVPEKSEPFLRDIIKHPPVCRYVQDWGKSSDMGLIAINEILHQPIGAAWIRLLIDDNRGYAFVDNKTPELAIAIMKEYRGYGIGTRLLKQLIVNAQTRHPAISLSVAADNPAVRFYRRLGFETLKTSENSIVMIKKTGSVGSTCEKRDYDSGIHGGY